MVGGGRSAEKEVRRWRRLVGEGAPVVDRRRGVAGQVHEGEAKLGMGSARAERLWRGRSTVSSGSPAYKWTAAAFWGLGAGNWRKSERISRRGFLWCRCARKREWRGSIPCCPRRRRGGDRRSRGGAWPGEQAPARGKEGGVKSGRDAWETTASRRWPGPSTAAGGAAQRRRR